MSDLRSFDIAIVGNNDSKVAMNVNDNNEPASNTSIIRSRLDVLKL